VAVEDLHWLTKAFVVVGVTVAANCTLPVAAWAVEKIVDFLRNCCVYKNNQNFRLINQIEDVSIRPSELPQWSQCVLN